MVQSSNETIYPAGPSHSKTQDPTSKSTSDSMCVIFPSLEYIRLLYPWPPPTILATPTTSTNDQNKGKERAIEEDDSNYEPEQPVQDVEDSGECIELIRTRKAKSQSSKKRGNKNNVGPSSPYIGEENTGEVS